MTSQSKSDAARANGAKSRGPTTREGKAQSSQNAIKHGLTANANLLPGESEHDFEALLEAHRTHHRPAGALEEELVRNLAVARWRLSRVAALEARLFDNEMARSQNQIDEEFTEIDDLGRLAFVFGKLAEFAGTLTKGAHVQIEGELRSREYASTKTDSKQRIWEIRVDSILKLDRAEKAGLDDQDVGEGPAA